MRSSELEGNFVECLNGTGTMSGNVELPPRDLRKASAPAGASEGGGSGEKGKFTVLNILPGMGDENGQEENNGGSSWRLTGASALTPTEAALLQHQKVRVCRRFPEL